MMLSCPVITVVALMDTSGSGTPATPRQRVTPEGDDRVTPEGDERETPD